MTALRLVLVLALSAAPALAEIPPLSPEELDASATHVVAGEVAQVYTARREKEGDWVDELVCIEIRVLDVEKGEGIAPGQVVHARTWQAEDRPDGWAGPGGQYTIPEVGTLVRVHLETAADGSREILMPNGINAAGEYHGKLRHEPWSKSAESFAAGGSDYFVLDDAKGEKHFVRPTAAISEDALKALAGKEVVLRAALVPGTVEKVDPNMPHPDGMEEVRRGHGLRVYLIEARK